MRFSEDAQELLERLWLSAEEGSEQLAVTDPILESMDELSRSGLVIQDGLFWKLTDSGHPEAAQATDSANGSWRMF